MSNAPTCRNCQHATWVMSKGGKQIKQRTPGECGKFKELARLALAAETAPGVQIMAFRRDIWPLTPAHKCPGFVRKGPVDL